MAQIILTINPEKITKDFEKKLDESLQFALLNTGYVILEEAEKLTPIDRGDLTGSLGVAIGGKVKTIGSKATLNPDVSNMAKYELRVSANTAYAYEVHEEYNDKFVGVKSAQKWGIQPNQKQEEFGYKFLAKAIHRVNVIKLIERYMNVKLAR